MFSVAINNGTNGVIQNKGWHIKAFLILKCKSDTNALVVPQAGHGILNLLWNRHRDLLYPSKDNVIATMPIIINMP